MILNIGAFQIKALSREEGGEEGRLARGKVTERTRDLEINIKIGKCRLIKRGMCRARRKHVAVISVR